MLFGNVGLNLTQVLFLEVSYQKKGGCFQISPENEYKSTQYYIENTNILVTHFKATDGEFRVIDFAPRFLNFERHHKPISFFRKIELINGSPFN